MPVDTRGGGCDCSCPPNAALTGMFAGMLLSCLLATLVAIAFLCWDAWRGEAGDGDEEGDAGFEEFDPGPLKYVDGGTGT